MQIPAFISRAVGGVMGTIQPLAQSTFTTVKANPLTSLSLVYGAYHVVAKTNTRYPTEGAIKNVVLWTTALRLFAEPVVGANLESHPLSTVLAGGWVFARRRVFLDGADAESERASRYSDDDDDDDNDNSHNERNPSRLNGGDYLFLAGTLGLRLLGPKLFTRPSWATWLR